MPGLLAEMAYNPQELVNKAENFNFEAEAGPTSGPTTYSPTSDSLVSDQLGKLLSSNSTYLQRARTSADQTAASRGLLNSSIAAGAGEGAAIDRALPIAQQDASSFFQSQRDNTGAANTFAQDANNFKRQGALAKYQGVLSATGEAGRLDLSNRQLASDQANKDASLQLERDRLVNSIISDNARLGLSQRELDARIASDAAQLGMTREQLAAQIAQNQAQLQLSRDQIGQQGVLANQDLALRAQAQTNQTRQTDAQIAQQAAQTQLQRDQLSLQAVNATKDDRAAVAARAAEIQQSAINARTQIESNPNLDGPAKAAAINAIALDANNTMRTFIANSGYADSMSWPEAMPGDGTPAAGTTPAAAPAPAPAAAPAPTPAQVDAGQGDIYYEQSYG